MTPTILISGTIEAATTAVFDIRQNQRATLFAHGLAGSEAVAVSLVIDPATVLAQSSLALSTSATMREISAPGQYQVSISSSAGAVKIGVFK